MARAVDDSEDDDREQHGPRDEFWQRVDIFVQRFEEAWQGGRPVIEDFLPKDCQDRLHRAVLIELCEVDLETATQGR